MSARFAVVYEAPADFQTATELADRVLRDAIGWLDDDLLENQREWIAELAGGRRLTWTGMKRLASEAGIPPVHGHFDGEPGLPDAAAARRAILFLLRECDGLQGIVLVRDQDGDLQRRKGLDLARGQDRSGTPIVVGLAITKRECWVISGFEPRDEAETEYLKAVRQQLGFDPRHQSHELTAGKKDAPRSSKRVLRELSGDDRDRECRCWRDTALSFLQERGTKNGLTAYLDEVRELLAGVIDHVRRPQ